MAYGKRLTISFTSFTGVKHEFNIWKRDYSGAAVERDGCPSAVKIDWGDNGGDDFANIVGSEATVQFYSEAQNEFEEFYVADKREFYGELLEISDGLPDVQLWRGWIVAEQRNEKLGYKAVVELKFMCGLGELKNIDFANANGDAYTGRVSFLSIIATILSKLETGLDIHTATSFRPTGTTGDPLVNMFVDQGIYEGMACDEVLGQVAAGCRVMMTNYGSIYSCFWLVQDYGVMQYLAGIPIANVATTPVTYMRYDDTGAYLDNYMRNQVIGVDNETTYHIEAPGFSNWSAWDHIDFTSTFARIENTLLNGSFDKHYDIGWDIDAQYEEFLFDYELDDGTMALKIQGGNFRVGYENYLIRQRSYQVKQTDPDSGFLRLRFKYNLVAGETGIGDNSKDIIYFGLHIQDDDSLDKLIGRLHYDQDSGQTWVVFDVPYGDVDDPAQDGINVAANYSDDDNKFEVSETDPVSEQKASDLTDYEVLVSIPTDCTLTLSFWQYTFDANAQNARDDYFLIIDEVSVDYVDEDGEEYPEDSEHRLLNTARFVNNGEEFELLQGATIDDPNRANIYKSAITCSADSSDYIDTLHSDVTDADYSYTELIGRMVMSNHRRPALCVDFELLTDQYCFPNLFLLDPNSSITKILAFVGISIDFEESIVSGSMVALLPFDETSTLTTTPGESSSSGSSSGSSTTNSHNPLTLAANCAAELTLSRDNQVISLDLSGRLEGYAGIVSLVAGWSNILIPEQPDINYNPVCNTYDGADNVVGNKVAYSTLEVARFSIWVNKACTLRWEIFRHT